MGSVEAILIAEELATVDGIYIGRGHYTQDLTFHFDVSGNREGTSTFVSEIISMILKAL